MLKVLLVDDEPAICELLKRLIEWENLNLACVGTAGDGLEAGRFINQHRPDIVITDIQLPGVTGLELIENTIQTMQTPPQFVVISGFREFEFAQRALRFGVEDYLLKPIDKNEINFVLSQLISKIHLSHVDLEVQREMKNTLEERTSILRQSELKNVVASSLKSRNADYQINTDYFHFNEEDGLFLFFMVRVQLAEISLTSCREVSQILRNVISCIQSRFGGNCFDIEISEMEDNAIGLLNYSPQKYGSIDGVRNVLQHILTECNAKFIPNRLVVALGKPVSSVRQLKNAFRQASAAIDMRIRIDISRVIEYNQALEETSIITESEKNELFDILLYMRKDEVRPFILRLFERILTEYPSRIGCLYGELYWMFCDDCEKLNANAGGGGADTQAVEPLGDRLLMYRIHNCLTYEEMREMAIGCLEAEIDYWKTLRNDRESEPIRIAKRYVQEHLDQQIKLEDVATEAYVSAAYLGILFKQKTGENFSDYITEARMERAKVLLRETHLSIVELAEKVGYSDSRYFTKVFQKYYKITPTIYRKFYS